LLLPPPPPAPAPCAPSLRDALPISSALCYVFGYFPIMPANHFRYTFWPALALTLAVVLAIAMLRRSAPYDSGAASSDSAATSPRSEEHTSELQSRFDLVCRLLLEKK